MGWSGFGCDPGEGQGTLDHGSNSADRRVWIAFLMGKKGMLPLLSQQERKKILMPVYLGLLKVSGWEDGDFLK